MDTETKNIPQAIKDLGLSMECLLIDPCIASEEMKNGSKWSITISRAGHGAYETTYSMGAAHRKWHVSPNPKNHSRIPEYWEYCNMRADDLKNGGKLSQRSSAVLSRLKESNKYYKLWTDPTTPDLVSVLYCLVSDAQSVCWGNTFEDWCSDLGYDTDSRKAEKCFNACRDIHYALVRMGLDIEMLSDLFKDY